MDWCNVNSNAGPVTDHHGEERAELEGKAFYLALGRPGLSLFMGHPTRPLVFKIQMPGQKDHQTKHLSALTYLFS